MNSIENLLYKSNKQFSLLKRKIKKFLLQHQEQLRIKYEYLELKCKKDKVSKEQMLLKLKIEFLLMMLQRRQMEQDVLIRSIQILSRTSFLVLTYNDLNLFDNFNIFGGKKTSDYLVARSDKDKSNFITIFFYDKHIPQWHLRLSKPKQSQKVVTIRPVKDHILYSLNRKNTVQQDKMGLKTKNVFLEFSYLCFFFYKYKNNLSVKGSFLSIEIKNLVHGNHISKERQRIKQILLKREMEKQYPLFQYSLNQICYTFYKLKIFVNYSKKPSDYFTKNLWICQIQKILLLLR